MIFKAYCIRDRRTGGYWVPFFSVNDAAACRTVRDSMDTGNLLGKHAQDFELYRVGEFSDDDAALSQPNGAIQFVCDLNFLKGPENASQSLHSAESVLAGAESGDSAQ